MIKDFIFPKVIQLANHRKDLKTIVCHALMLT
jgi:hypothetical protein